MKQVFLWPFQSERVLSVIFNRVQMQHDIIPENPGAMSIYLTGVALTDL